MLFLITLVSLPQRGGLNFPLDSALQSVLTLSSFPCGLKTRIFSKEEEFRSLFSQSLLGQYGAQSALPDAL
ncbi:hypothetical protein MHYP_G00351610 [Metynnis hypsauchen]